MVSSPSVNPPASLSEPAVAPAPLKDAPKSEDGPLAASPAPDRGDSSPALDGRQIFFLFVGSAVAACLIFALGVAVGRRVEQRALAREKAAPADPLAVLDEIANAEEALTFHRAVLERSADGHASPAAGASLPSAAAERSARYTLMSSTFAQRAAADEILRRLRESSYKVKVLETVTPGQRPVFRLQVGDFGSAEGAQPIRGELLQRFGLATTVTKSSAAPQGE